MRALGLRAAIVASVLTASSVALAAQALPPPDTVLTTVDSVERAETHFTVVGIVRGESVSRPIEFWTYSSDKSGVSLSGDSCERAALLMINRPGRFTLEVRIDSASDIYSVCRLVRQ